MSSANDKERNLVFEIVPGESIGPFRLGMTRAQIEELSRQTGVRTDIAVFHGGMVVDFDRDDRAVRIQVPADFGAIRLAIAGEELKYLYNSYVLGLLARIITLPSDRREPTHAGIEILHWDGGELTVFAFEVSLPG
jgi:hypothetical protein